MDYTDMTRFFFSDRKRFRVDGQYSYMYRGTLLVDDGDMDGRMEQVIDAHLLSDQCRVQILAMGEHKGGAYAIVVYLAIPGDETPIWGEHPPTPGDISSYLSKLAEEIACDSWPFDITMINIAGALDCWQNQAIELDIGEERGRN